MASNTINLGEVYIKSTTKGYFWVKNSTKKTISVQLFFKENELKNSMIKSQIIPSCHEAGF